MIVLIVLLQFIVCAVTLYKLRSRAQRFALLLCNLSFFCYSCLGIAMFDLEQKYYFSYGLAMLAFNLFFLLGDAFCRTVYPKKEINGQEYGSSIDYYIHSRSHYLKFFAFIYLALRVAALLYPEFYLKYLFQPPNFRYQHLLEAINDNYSTTFGHLLSTATTITMPFAYIYLRKQKPKYIIWFSVFDLVAQYLVGRGSIGRLAIIRNILVVCLAYYLLAKDARQRRRVIRITAVAGVVSLMLYFVMENLRGGSVVSVSDVSLFGVIRHFIESEFYYPTNYDLAEILYQQEAYLPSTFWLWLITLPIPKVIFSLSSVDPTTSVIYKVFTYYYWGGHWSDGVNYAGILTSVLGDGIMVYGVYGAFILIIPFAFFIGFFLKFIEKLKDSEFLYCTILFYFFVSFRPGVQYALQHVNTFVGILLVVLLFKLFSHETQSDRSLRGYSKNG